MTVRELQGRDAADLLRFMKQYFPEEEALLGTRPEGFFEVVRRIFRWDVRFVLGLLRLVGRPIFRFFVVEEAGRLVATTLLTFSRRAGYVSMVVVDPAWRRRGLAQSLLERARAASRARRRPYLVLDVLAANTPARALYDRLGFRTLRETAYFVHERPDGGAPPAAAVPGLRPFRSEDARALVATARRVRPAVVEEVLPATERELTGSPWEGDLLASERAAWVIDDGAGAVAWVAAAVSRATEAGHLSSPILAESLDPERALGLVATATRWCADRGSPRVLAMVPRENERGRAALVGAGFREAIPVLTLYRGVR